MKTFLLIIFIYLILSASAFGQGAEVSAVSTNGPLALTLPLPEYPEAARKAGFYGSVSVVVTIDGKGNVTAANASRSFSFCPSVTLPPEFLEMQNLSVESAKKAKFNPSDYYSSRTGSISYTFHLPKEEVPKDKTGNAADDRKVDRDREPLADTEKAKAEMVPTPTHFRNVENGVALSVPKPSYPAAARGSKAGGQVSVQVLISEDGSVYLASAVSGDPLLRDSSEIAACNAKFSPTRLSGVPVRVSAVIHYNFIPPK